jgi:hypothetical protein
MNDNDLNVVYKKFWDLTAELLPDYGPEAIAGVMVAQALMMYRTVLSDFDYQAMVDTISDTRDKVHKIKAPEIQ